MANRVLKLLIISLLSSAFVQAQETPKPLPRHPGDVIKYEIKFDGPNADKIKTVYAMMNTGQAPPKDQAGFTTQLNTPGQVHESSSKTFIIEIPIPDNTATGDYHLRVVGAVAAEGSAEYGEQDFSVPAIHIVNPRTFTPPAITVKPLP
jgi:hypothetical protein